MDARLLAGHRRLAAPTTTEAFTWALVVVALIVAVAGRSAAASPPPGPPREIHHQRPTQAPPPYQAPKPGSQVQSKSATFFWDEWEAAKQNASLAVAAANATATAAAASKDNDNRLQAHSTMAPTATTTATTAKTATTTTTTTNTTTITTTTSTSTNPETPKLPEYHIDPETKLIFVHEENEIGLIVGEINGNLSDANQQANRTRRTRSRQPTADDSDDHHDDSTVTVRTADGGSANTSATNYTVYLISRHRAHIAIAIDIESIDFEPIKNCESQEIRFSVVAEMSKEITPLAHLDPLKTSSPAPETEEAPSTTTIPSVSETETTERSAGGRDSISYLAADEPAKAPLPVSEAMALILNMPLNRTLLNSNATNFVKTIDSSIYYLYLETCMEQRLSNKQVPLHRHRHKQSNGNHSTSSAGTNPRHRRPPHHRSPPNQPRKPTAGRKRSHDPNGRQQSTLFCNDKLLKESFFDKLNEYYEWDELKIVCGKTRRLYVPMRSLKLTVWGDEFSPNSHFRIRYQFISDPKQLPSQDNGKYYCRNRNVIDLKSKCDGVDDCGDASDESIKICGYPVSRTGATQRVVSSESSSRPLEPDTGVGSSVRPALKRRKLSYVNTDLLHCCQSNEWLSQQNANNEANNLQSIISDSLHLFSAPFIAPTDASGGDEREDTRRRPHHRRRFKRIVGGSVAPKGFWSAQASLQYEILEPLCHFCAGTLIHPEYVLTAGHCITKDGLTRGIKVVFGAHDLRSMDEGSVQVRYVDDAHIYPGVDVKRLKFEWDNDMNNDIALLRLNAPVYITPQVMPACLPPYNSPLAINTTCKSIGWGQTHGSGNSNVLKHLSLKVANSTDCSKELFEREEAADALNPSNHQPGAPNRPRTRLSRTANPGGSWRRNNARLSDSDSVSMSDYSNLTMVCVNNHLGHGICQGDSGGPLYCERTTPKGEQCTHIYGVASFIIQYATVGATCAVENLPGIFGEVSSKTEWISSTIKMFEQNYRLKYSK